MALRYKGWKITHWTGWKGRKHVATAAGTCFSCPEPIHIGETIHYVFHTPISHWTCRYPDNRLDRLHAQWIAEKETPSGTRFIEANCANSLTCVDILNIPAQEFKRGHSFEIPPDEMVIAEDAPIHVREESKQIGLKRLKLFIDELEATEVKEVE